MDARDRLRLYLEQRKELGESDLTLDQLPVADVLAMLGAKSPAGGARPASSRKPAEAVRETRPAQTDETTDTARGAAPRPDPAAGLDAPPAPPPPTPRFDPNAPVTTDWRAALRASGATGIPAPKPEASSPTTPPEQPPATSVPSSSPSDAPSLLPLGEGIEPAPAWLTALEIPLGLTVGQSRQAVAPGSSGTPASLADVAAAIATCTACALHASATHHVPGEGNPGADFVCVGEAPGQNEDESGRPFVGPAGQLLTKILGAIDMPRDEVFICNVLKHRPPGNRNPAPDEVLACQPFLEQQLALLQPRVILALGTFAAQTLLNTKASLGALRGRIHRYHGVPLIVTYHPAALLRNEAWKRPTWQDVQLARRIHDASREANPANPS